MVITVQLDFDVGNVGATKMACDNMMTEQKLFSVLEQVNKYVVNEGLFRTL